MIVLTDDELQQLEDYAGLFLNWDEIAILMGLNPEAFQELLSDTRGIAYMRYFYGRTKAIKEIREHTVKMARSGSMSAKEQCEQYIDQQYAFERKITEDYDI